MSWRDDLRPASFRGVPFFVADAEGQGGRRGALHQYPQRDTPYWEDLGRQARTVTLTAYLIGDDVAARAARLIEVLEAAGPGYLVHPHKGTMRMAVASYRETHRVNQGRSVWFEITFQEAGEAAYPATTADTTARVGAAADAAHAAQALAFADAYSLAGLPGWVSDDLAGQLTRHLDTIGRVVRTARTIAADPAAYFQRQLASFTGDALQLVGLPRDLVAQVTGIVQDVRAIFPDASAARTSLQSIAAATPAPISAIPAAATPARQAVEAHGQLIAGAVRRAALIEEVRALSQTPFAGDLTALEAAGPVATPYSYVYRSDAAGATVVVTVPDASALRDDLSARIEAELDVAGGAGPLADDRVYAALSDLRAAMVRDVAARAVDLARTRTVVTCAELPALVLAHQAYGDRPAQVLAGESGLIVRNAIRHPGFVPGGAALELVEVRE